MLLLRPLSSARQVPRADCNAASASHHPTPFSRPCITVHREYQRFFFLTPPPSPSRCLTAAASTTTNRAAGQSRVAHSGPERASVTQATGRGCLSSAPNRARSAPPSPRPSSSIPATRGWPSSRLASRGPSHTRAEDRPGHQQQQRQGRRAQKHVAGTKLRVLPGCLSAWTSLWFCTTLPLGRLIDPRSEPHLPLHPSTETAISAHLRRLA